MPIRTQQIYLECPDVLPCMSRISEVEVSKSPEKAICRKLHSGAIYEGVRGKSLLYLIPKLQVLLPQVSPLSFEAGSWMHLLVQSGTFIRSAIMKLAREPQQA